MDRILIIKANYIDRLIRATRWKRDYLYNAPPECVNLFLEISYFLYLLADENILNSIYYNQINIGYQDMSFITILIKNYWIYNKLWRKSKHIKTVPQIKIPLQSKIQLIHLEYDAILNKIVLLKQIFRQIIISKYDECIKYSDYAEEECQSSEKLLLSLSKINKYDVKLDNLITNIIMLPIQKHTFCISTHMNVVFPTSKIHEHCININLDNIIITSSFKKLFQTLKQSTLSNEIEIYF